MFRYNDDNIRIKAIVRKSFSDHDIDAERKTTFDVCGHMTMEDFERTVLGADDVECEPLKERLGTISRRTPKTYGDYEREMGFC